VAPEGPKVSSFMTRKSEVEVDWTEWTYLPSIVLDWRTETLRNTWLGEPENVHLGLGGAFFLVGVLVFLAGERAGFGTGFGTGTGGADLSPRGGGRVGDSRGATLSWFETSDAAVNVEETEETELVLGEVATL